MFKFSLPWQQGSSEQSFTDSSKLADPENPLDPLVDPENPLVGASIWVVSSAEAKLRCGGIFNDRCFAYFEEILTVKEF